MGKLGIPRTIIKQIADLDGGLLDFQEFHIKVKTSMGKLIFSKRFIEQIKNSMNKLNSVMELS